MDAVDSERLVKGPSASVGAVAAKEPGDVPLRVNSRIGVVIPGPGDNLGILRRPSLSSCIGSQLGVGGSTTNKLDPLLPLASCWR